MRREIIHIDEELCDGCGLCVPSCPEGALRIVDGKAKLTEDFFCDGLGACIGHCPKGAIRIEKREADEYDERRVMENVARKGAEAVREHLEHLDEHGEREHLSEAVRYLVERDLDVPEKFADSTEISGTAGCGCPGSRVVDMRESKEQQRQQTGKPGARRTSRLRQWPVQIRLVPPNAPYFDGADLLIAADCVPFAYNGFHEDLLDGRVVLVGCPKLDNAEYYREKIGAILSQNDIRSVTVAHMEVPCCFGLVSLVKEAAAASGKKVPIETVRIGINGECMEPPAALAR